MSTVLEYDILMIKISKFHVGSLRPYGRFQQRLLYKSGRIICKDENTNKICCRYLSSVTYMDFTDFLISLEKMYCRAIAIIMLAHTTPAQIRRLNFALSTGKISLTNNALMTRKTTGTSKGTNTLLKDVKNPILENLSIMM